MAKCQAIAHNPQQTMQPVPELERLFKLAPGHWDDWVWQIKHDGVRTLYDPDNKEFYSRNAKVYPNFGVFLLGVQKVHDYISQVLISCGITTKFHLDGEVAGERFKAVMEQVFREEEVDMTGLNYYLFDFTLHGMSFKDRHELLTQAVLHTGAWLQGVYAVPYQPCPKFKDIEEAEVFIKSLIDNGNEGCVFKHLHSPYRHGKKHPDWVKGILEETLDLPVLSVEEGKGKLKGCVGKFVCEMPDGTTVDVAPGRAPHGLLKYWWENQHEIPGLIEVMFKSKTDSGSLRHPRFKRSREDK